jgi:hypothetical protein
MLQTKKLIIFINSIYLCKNINFIYFFQNILRTENEKKRNESKIPVIHYAVCIGENINITLFAS